MHPIHDMPIEKEIKIAEIPKTPWRFFIYISRIHKKWALFAIVVVWVASTAGTLLSYFFKLIIDAVELDDYDSAMFWALLYPVAILLVQLTYRLSGYAGAYWTSHSNKSAMDILTAYLLKHSHGYFIDRFAGSITSKVRNVTSAFDETIPDFLWGHLTAMVTFLITFVIIARVDFKSSLVFIALIFVLIFINKKFAYKKSVLSKKNAEASSLLQGQVTDTFSNISTVRQYVMGEHEKGKLRHLTQNKFNTGMANWLYTEKMLLTNSIILFFFAFVMFWLLVDKWGQGLITTGDFVLVLALVSQITGTLLFIGRAFNATARTIGELKEGLDDIFIPYEIENISNALDLKVSEGRVDWKDVDFNFSGVKVFDNFNLEIPSRQRLGLVGSSGAGKSTFVSLILRQHEIKGGVIEIDGQDISKITQDSLREAIAVVPQEPSLFHRTIRENIAYSKPKASLDEVIAIAKLANAHEFIQKLPQGYDTLVGERGIKLSGGQKQRVAIARAMLKNAPILILDEATSALDSESEKEIQKALHTLMEGKTVIAIAHRLSTLREMDRIIVLEEGIIKEDGNHESLLNIDGLYANLWQHQAGGFINE